MTPASPTVERGSGEGVDATDGRSAHIYLERGLAQPGGRLPLFDREGCQIDRKTVESCIEHGWAEPWFANPIKADWRVCEPTAAGYVALGRKPPRSGD